jgi:hypothetical protein
MTTLPISMDQLHDLWGAGFTIAPRPRDPFEIDPKLIPRGMTYQWNRECGGYLPNDWRPVPNARHPGLFAPWGTGGDVEVGGLFLCERPEQITRRSREQETTKAKQLIDDWAMKAAADGITGSVCVGTQTAEGKLDALTSIEIGPGEMDVTKVVEIGSTKTIETTVGVPTDMFPYMNEVFRERDRLEAELVRKDRTLVPGPIADKFYAAIEADKAAPWWPTLRAILLPIAVENVRAELKKEKADD